MECPNKLTENFFPQTSQKIEKMKEGTKIPMIKLSGK